MDHKYKRSMASSSWRASSRNRRALLVLGAVIMLVVIRLVGGRFFRHKDDDRYRNTISVLHPRTPDLPELHHDRGYKLEDAVAADVATSTASFEMYGKTERGLRNQWSNRKVLAVAENKANDSVLIVLSMNDAQSWGPGRTAEDFFTLIGNFTYPKPKTSVTVLTSSLDEHAKLAAIMERKIHEYAQFTLIFRNDFNLGSLTRANRHDDWAQRSRRRMLARYRNYALLSSLEAWHQHVVWIDADIKVIPAHLVAKMVAAGRDVLEPLCLHEDGSDYDKNAWVGIRKSPGPEDDKETFVPEPLNVTHIGPFHGGPDEFVAMDSVGGTMLYVRAEVHRQGVLFPHHYVIGSEWNSEGYDAIETEGLCYLGHFLGYRCWAMPNEAMHMRAQRTTTNQRWLAILAVICISTVLVNFSTLGRDVGSSQVSHAQAAESVPSISVLHPRTPSLPALHRSHRDELQRDVAGDVDTFKTTFEQYGKHERGLRTRWSNRQVLGVADNLLGDSVLIVVSMNDAHSWGTNRSAEHFFALIGEFTHPKPKTSVTVLTSSQEEHAKLAAIMQRKSHEYAQMTLIFRNDFNLGDLTRENRHDDSAQRSRRRMLARYRNYALQSSLEAWHQHVVWIDADVHVIPPGLVSKMVVAGRDVLEPLCLHDEGYDYDLNAWVGQRKVPGPDDDKLKFVPEPLNVKHIGDFKGGADDFVGLDSVGGTMLYVRAEVHRQGVLFPHHYVIGSEWGAEGYDGIETEGLCYSAHFLGFKCWAMPNDIVWHSL
ncbi:TPA: LOW QUALITY PROTEIN: hypothetical protein N0F65_009627 [Lagenidium giganteum]|uniref:Uncharacterized protein n=1 Tax=Lagenidium giganteum TaxID=4803 RepID=A0AAV2YV63_9STRA|nr:TPA: LOW QUALITY PROTEIN: hypothetical protein N0F65_009627 [Lagenidium giganteum]